jgi:hypothetical protein
LPVTSFRSPTNLSTAIVPDGGRRKLHATGKAVSDPETLKHANVTIGTLQEKAGALDSRLVVQLWR